MREPRFRTVVFDVDSTLSQIEGIEWLARLRGDDVYRRINEVTEQAMRGELEFSGVYAARLEAVRPTRDEVTRLGDAYIEHVSTGAVECVRALRDANVNLVIVSGGILNAVEHLARHLRIRLEDVHAVPLHFDEQGEYAGYDAAHPCARQLGKRTVISSLKLAAPSLLIGDGMTDAEARPSVDAFAAYTGAVRREEIVRLADFEVSSFDNFIGQITA